MRLRYWAGGDGPPLLLVHGFAGGAANFADLAELLAPRHRVLVPDLPGHGGSAPLPAIPNLAAYAESLATLCHVEGVERLDVVGHSLGGVVALRLASRRPGLVPEMTASARGLAGSCRRAW